MNKSNITLISLIFISTGCTSVPYNYRPTETTFSSPKIGQEATAELGEPILDAGAIRESDAIKINKEFSIKEKKIRPGTIEKMGEDGDYEYYSPYYTNSLIPVIADSVLGVPTSSSLRIKIKKSDNNFCVFSTGIDQTCHSDIDFKRTTVKTQIPKTVRRTLIYNGKVNNKLKIGYREFRVEYLAGDVARPAFSNEVEYDLNESKTIGYAGARIKILNATNNKITYQVIENFK
ncbi:hypothetical protein LH427_02870 [Laribacter hongkongensis]|uniref:hypothetical protein n=1 Tax=Laribacter hongkongensis TaxID=168471 RepID=UPI001EFD60DD|nr:hypothetical protein [Laribacter hongkongensis]MCG8991061.1 hypothetical protein [Laribacter hongkongensis]MCG8997768.1 hypothetical protein [Laribacter hongkongensis]MCG9001072.1 hypothetical protein [Laribacter hongkongensis]MCG9006113.1 hypothetical protein [Laribacter hongkongensis]MCG9012320.1 hypothetical protein [Laribacter hongkongensis]